MDAQLERQMRHLVDRAAIVDVIIGFANAFDAQDWPRLRSFLADELHTDYSQFRQEPPGLVRADAYVEARRLGLAGVRTVHLSTNHQVSIAGDTAACVSAYRIYRLAPHLPAGENRLDSAGNYEHALARTSAGWRLTVIRQTVTIQEGNPLVHGGLRPGA
ncbi:MAG: nuclear transport factor 2 family protein [bacterium]